MPKVRLTITEGRCRENFCKAGEEYIVENLRPPLCHELWHSIYPMAYALLNGADLDYGNTRAACFDARCPDSGRVCIHGERIEE